MIYLPFSIGNLDYPLLSGRGGGVYILSSGAPYFSGSLNRNKSMAIE